MGKDKKSKKLPFLQLYPADWQAEKSLNFCSWEARYVWFEMLLLMHQSPRRGFLLQKNGNPYTEADLVEVIHKATPQRIKDCLFELETHHVFSRDRNKVIYSRKMVKGEKKKKTARTNGKNGGNPALKKDDLQTSAPEMDHKKDAKKYKNGEIENLTNNGNKKEIGALDNQTLVIQSLESRDQRLYSKKESSVVKRPYVALGQKIAALCGWDKNPNWFGDYSRVEVWLDRGWDPEKDILPTIQRIIAKGKIPQTLKYFEGAIADAHAYRKSPTPEGKTNGRQPTRSELADAATQRALDTIAEEEALNQS